MEMPEIMYSIASGSRLGGHVTTIHASIEELIVEVNSTLECDNVMVEAIIEEYNETCDALNRPKFEKSVEEFDFSFIIENDPRLDMGGYGWSVDHINANGREDSTYLNISVHTWNGKFFVTEG